MQEKERQEKRERLKREKLKRQEEEAMKDGLSAEAWRVINGEEEDGDRPKLIASKEISYTHPVKVMSSLEQWPQIYDSFLDFDARGDLDGILTLAHDPLLMAHYILQRAPDDELPRRCCMVTRYPM